ncbi:MAG: tRNA lysidine(34) synthetase TilS [Piscirickettsiaceae bacterium]|nr:MAG: tRNA lysidine(34) synthetase TilS [Piscirickettsiaceae bacterium]
MPFRDAIRAVLQLVPDCKNIIIAYSGGVDSHVLMHVCSQIQNEHSSINFQAVYIDHGLQLESDDWRQHCETVSNELSIPFAFVRVNALDVVGEGPEQAARNARYSALKNLVNEATVLLTAQHEDDQAETLILQLLRGCGVHGLAAMPKIDDFSNGHIARPFLDISRQAIQDYAAAYQLHWVEDPSNSDLNINRNYLRKEVIPILKKRWPAFSRTTARTARYCGEAAELLDSQLAKYIDTKEPSILALMAVIPLKTPHQRAIIRHWLRLNGVKMPSSKIIDELKKNVIDAVAGKSPIIRWDNNEIRRFNNSLYLLDKLSSMPIDYAVEWLGDECELPSVLGKLLLSVSPSKGFSIDVWRSSKITVSFRRGGEKISLAGRGGSKTLKNLFNENKIRPWARDRVPLIFINNKLAAVADLWCDESFLAKENEPACQIKWLHPEFRIQ